MSDIQNQNGSSSGIKKSLYVFLCSLLGMLMFLILHRLLIFAYLLLASANPGVFYYNLTYLEILALDFFTLILAIMLGSWYGIALGIKWYEAIYEKGEHAGFIDHLVKEYWPSAKNHYNLKNKVESVTKELKDDVLRLEHLAKTIKPVIRETIPIKRRIVRRRGQVKI